MRRRELLSGSGAALVGAVVAPAVAAAAGAAAAGAVASASAAGPDPEVALLERLVELEYSAMVVYELLGAAPVAAHDTQLGELVALLARHERDHAVVLLNAAEYLGGRPQPPPPAAAVRRAVPAIDRVRSRHDLLAIALAAEQTQLRAYYAAQSQLDDTKLVQQTAMIMCSDAQHAALVREALGEDPIPAAFEVGVG